MGRGHAYSTFINHASGSGELMKVSNLSRDQNNTVFHGIHSVIEKDELLWEETQDKEIYKRLWLQS